MAEKTEESLGRWKSRRRIICSFLLYMLVCSPAVLGAEVYQKERARFGVGDRTLKGYKVKARATYPYPVSAVLDASHDRLHLSEIDQDIEREEVTRADCAEDICRINVHVLVGSFPGVGEITYDLDTQVQEQEDGSILIEWTKTTGTRFIKHLRGALELKPRTAEGQETVVDYHFEVVAPGLSVEKVASKAEAYLERLGMILDECHQEHPSLWAQMYDVEGGF